MNGWTGLLDTRHEPPLESPARHKDTDLIAMPAPNGNCLLYLDIVPGHPVQIRKLAGVRRYAALRGWDVVGVPRREMDRTDVRDLLVRHRPVGVVVEGSGRRNAFLPQLFGRTPVSYVEYPAEETAGRADEAVGSSAVKVIYPASGASSGRIS